MNITTHIVDGLTAFLIEVLLRPKYLKELMGELLKRI
jgi:hypothetical protein